MRLASYPEALHGSGHVTRLREQFGRVQRWFERFAGFEARGDAEITAVTGLARLQPDRASH